MDINTATIITGLATSVFANFATDSVKYLFNKAINLKPSIEDDLKNANSSNDFEKIFSDCVGVIDANAGQGSLDIDGGLLEALRGIRFDHNHGTVNIAGATIKSQVLVTGGSQGSTGTTTIGGNTEMKSKGTSIKVGNGCSIKISGNAQIKQS